MIFIYYLYDSIYLQSTHQVAIEEMKNGTRLGKLKDKILTKEPHTFFEGTTKAKKLIKMDDDRRLH